MKNQHQVEIIPKHEYMRMIRNVFFVFFVLFRFSLFSQNIAINEAGTAADASAMLDISGTNKGVLIPRVALASATTTVTIATPATGLLVYNDGTGGLTTAGYYYNSGTTVAPVWVQLLKGPPWFLLGNAGTLWNRHFLGTTDNVSLRFRTNNTAKMIIDSVGFVGIGTTSAVNALTITPGSISIGSDAFAIPAGRYNLMIAGPLGGATQGGGLFDASDQTWLTATNTYCAYIQNGIRTDGNIWQEGGKIGIGTASPSGVLHVVTSTTALGLTIQEQASDDADGYDLNFRKGRGTYTAKTIISAADELGIISFGGYSGAGGYVTGAAIKAISEGTIASPNRVPAHLSFWSGTDVAPTVLTERMRITSVGKVGIATTSPLSTLTVNGSIAGKYIAGNTIAMANTDMLIKLTGSGVCTLPSASSVAAGTMVIVSNTTGSAITLSRAGGDTMCNVGVAGCASTNVSVAANNVVRYVSDGTSVWVGW